VTYGKADLLSHAPTTEANLAKGALSVGALCQAAVELSDNTAANLLLRESGGPKALTRWLRGIGDGKTRLDRTEPTLNQALPGDPRDTTTPEAMAATVETLLLGGALQPGSRQKLMGWMIASTTGAARLRAGEAKGWSVADKTGTGLRGTVNDIGLLIPSQGAPIAVAVYTHGATAPQAEVEAVHAEVARLLTGGGA
jgi:beta-lactamase class A